MADPPFNLSPNLPAIEAPATPPPRGPRVVSIDTGKKPKPRAALDRPP